jgi:hypothetical protein
MRHLAMESKCILWLLGHQRRVKYDQLKQTFIKVVNDLKQIHQEIKKWEYKQEIYDKRILFSENAQRKNNVLNCGV